MKFEQVLKESTDNRISIGDILIEYALYKGKYKFIIKFQKTAQYFAKKANQPYVYNTVEEIISDIKNGLADTIGNKTSKNSSFVGFKQTVLTALNKTNNKNKSLTYDVKTKSRYEKNPGWDASVTMYRTHKNGIDTYEVDNFILINGNEEEELDKRIYKKEFDRRRLGNNELANKPLPKIFKVK